MQAAAAARHSREARLRFWRVTAVTSFFAIVLGANVIVGAAVVMGKIRAQSGAEKSLGDAHTALVKRPMLDGTFCRNVVYSNETSQAIEEKVEPCDQTKKQARGRTRTQFSWGGK